MKQTLKAFLTHSLPSFYGMTSSKLQNPYRGAAQDRLVGMQAAKEPETSYNLKHLWFSPGPTVDSTGQETQPTRQSHVCGRSLPVASPGALFSLLLFHLFNSAVFSAASQEPFSERRWLMDLLSHSPSSTA